MALPRVFISYRRGDSAPYAGRLNDRLSAALGPDQVFMDLEDIAPGQNFSTVLNQNLDTASVVLVLIGPNWLSATHEDGKRRLEDERDYVRFEIVESLRLNKRVIPVLLNATPMPQSNDLSVDLQAFVFCQALQLTDANFDRDVATLIHAIGGTRPDFSLPKKLVVGGLLLALMVAGGLFINKKMREPQTGVPTPTSIPVAETVTNADITGTWQGEVVYEWDHSKYTERFQFKPIADVLTGTASFLTVPRGIQGLELKGNTISFETHTKGSMGDKEINYVHHYRGKVNGDAMHLVMQTTGGYDAAMPREIVAQRTNRE